MEKLESIRKSLGEDDAEGLDMVLDDIGVNPETCALEDLEDAVRQSVFKFNDANTFDEYESEEFYGREYNADNIYKAIIKLFDRGTDLEKSLGYRPEWLDESLNNSTTIFIDKDELLKYAEEYITNALDSKVSINRRDDGQYTLTMNNDDATVDKWLKLHGNEDSKSSIMKEFVYICANCGRQCDDDYNLGTLIDGQWYCETCVTEDVRDCFGRLCTFPELVDSCRAQLLDGALDDPEHVKTLTDSQLDDLAQQYAEEEWKNAKPSDETNVFESLRESYINDVVSELLN